MNNSQRRRFLRLGAKTITGAGLALGANPMWTLAHAADNNPNTSADYRAMVCVYLEGGSDGFSMLVPMGTAEYNEYNASRQGLSVDYSQLDALTTQSGNGGQLGLHSNMSGLRDMFNDGRMGLIGNVGNIVVPTTKEQYQNNAVPLPAQLFSHSDQEIQWQQLQGRGRAENGWGAIAARHLSSFQTRDYLTAVTLDGSNYWQSGEGQRPYSIKETGLREYAGLSNGSDYVQPRLDAFLRVAQQPQSHVLARAYADIQNRAVQITAELGKELESSASIITSRPDDNSLAAQLGMVARLIASRGTLGMRRQIFYVRMKGFDVHDHQSKNNPVLFKELSEAMTFFQNTLDSIGESQNVTTFTASDFGRSLSGNGDGTDHGWGNHMMVMGGAVKGGDLYGSMPRMNINGPDAIQNGRVVPTLAAAQYAGTLLRWMGLPEDQLQNTLPTLANFQQQDLGFMS